MSAVLTAQEPSAKYLVQMQPPLVRYFDLIAQAPGGVARLRELILTLAVQGKLVPQDPSDEPASELLKKIRAEKDRLIAEGKIKRDKPLAEIADEEKPFELPGGWHWMRLASVGDWAIGSGFPVESQGMQNLPVLFAKVSDMNLPGNEKFLYSANNSIDYVTVDKLRVNVHQAGTVVFPKIGGAIATNKRRILVKPTAIDNNCLGITPSAGIATNYLYLLLTSIDFTKYQAGTSVPALSQGTLGEIVIGLPPLAEQSRIVTRVEELMQLCDALEASGQLEAQKHAQLVNTLLGTLTQSETPEALADNWQRIATHFDVILDRPEAVDALEQTILQLAVRGLLVPQDPTDEPASVHLQKIRTEKDHLITQGKIKRDKPLPPITDEEKPFELPQGWEWARLQQAYDVRDGTHDTPKYQATGFPLVTSKNIYGGVLDLSDVKLISAQDHEQISARSKVDRNDILFAMIGSIGNPVLVDTDLEFSVKNVALFKYYAAPLSCPPYLLLLLCHFSA